ncbi:MAG: hypothetical protein GXZ11_00450 [Tissierellia bacterium]|nr:hypothetical protein [Tissierellia bacterium]
MIGNHDLTIGQVVRSKAGKDKGQFFVVGIALDADHVEIYDGNKRKLQNPKKKRVKHLAKTQTVIPQMESILKDPDQRYNAMIRQTLKPFKEKV